MPYIAPEYRDELNPHIDQLVSRIASEGEMNYCISQLLGKYFGINRDTGQWEINYNRINSAIGVLECAKLEFYRRLAAPYEDKKIKTNGDISVYSP